MTGPSALALTVEHNKKGRRDASHAFIPEAHRFVEQARNSGYVAGALPINNKAPLARRREQVLRHIAATGELRHLAIFCHGWRSGIQMGFRLRHLEELVGTFAMVCDVSNPYISLYCCSTGKGFSSQTGGDGGFADKLRDTLCRHGMVDCRVDAHVTAGHTTRNPYKRRFEGRGSPAGGIGGFYLVEPRGELWRTWRTALRETYLRYHVTRMDVGEIHRSLLGVA